MNLLNIFRPANVLRYPRLDTILMVENAIRNAKEYPTKKQLIKSLPNKIMFQTLNLILDYLEYSGKIHVGKDRKIAWIWDPKGVKKFTENKELVIR